MKLQYINHSPDSISYIWFHVWPNAYRNDRTDYSEQLLENGDTRYYFSSRDQKGYLNRLNFRVNGTLAVIEDHPEFIDVVKLLLPKKLLPGDSISISSSFHVRIPYNFNGNGYNAHHFDLKNWYPEPAVYDQYGWHPMTFLTQGGAYHEAGDFDVEIEAPPAYQIASGSAEYPIRHTDTNNVQHFILNNANSFAWIADNQYHLKTDSLIDIAGKHISIQYFYLPVDAVDFNKLLTAVKDDLIQLSRLLGPYQQSNISIVQSTPLKDQRFTGLVYLNSNKNWENVLRMNLIGQWFETTLLTNERIQPWFSKGFIHYYNQQLASTSGPENAVTMAKNDLWLRVAEHEKTTQAIHTTAPEFSVQNDSLIASTKAALWLEELKDTLGEQRFDEVMRRFISNWQFSHPYPQDFKNIVDSASKKNMQTFFGLLDNNQSLFYDTLKRKIKPAFVFSARNSEKYNYIGLAPVPGYNQYDGFMLGATIHNINVPQNKFEFLLTPMFAFGSQKFVGIGRLSYTWFPDSKFSRITLGINGAHFNTNKATDSTGKLLYENYSKLVPYIRVDFKPATPRSSISKWMDLKTYLINELNYDDFDVSSQDSLIHPNAVSNNFRYLNQLSFNLEDNRVLYPYNLRVELQQSALFYRINLQANYFLNYPEGGGLQVRLFAAKFGVWNENNHVDVSRYEPKLLGVNGNEDYLYEDYFIGRSASYAIEKSSVSNAGIAAQQIMNRDGGLKLRIDDFDFVQGKSSNWVSSLNFNTTLPAHLFPFPVPIRIFFDVGTYAEAWENNPPTSRFLYTGGIQLSLFHNLLNIYAPLIYSSDFKEALGTTSFGNRITFSIDVQNINYKKIIRRAADHE